MTPYSAFEQRYMDYAGTFRLPDGTLPEAMQRKLEHTLEVVQFSDRIAEAEHFSEEEAFLSKLAALFHDTARYKQVALYHTFNDSASKFDHGHEGARLLLEKELLAGLAPDQACAVLTAVELHNKAHVDFSRLGGIFPTPAKAVRDADKLSILRLLTDFITGKLEIKDKSILLLERANSPEISPAVSDAVLTGKPCLYRELHTINDFKVALFAWCNDLNYVESARIILKAGFYDDIRRFLPDLPVTDAIHQKTIERLKCLSCKSAD